MALDERAGVAGVALPVEDTRGAGIGLLIRLSLLERRQPHHGGRSVQLARAFVAAVDIVRVQLRDAFGYRLPEEGDAAHVFHLVEAGPPVEPFGNRNHCPLCVAVDQEIGLRVGEDRPAHLVRPVIVMRDPPQ